MLRHIAIVGSGPAGYYTAEAAQKHFGDAVRIDIFDRLPVPFGLIRFGVAPDHQSIKGVAKRYEKVALTDNVRFVGNVEIGRDVTVAELKQLYDAVVLATGAPRDRALGVPGEELGNVFGSAQFVGWYNGHPEFAGLEPDLSGKSVAIIGVGNVALDVARILAKSQAELRGSDIVAHALEALANSALEHIYVIGRRGPLQIAMTPRELGELGQLERAAPIVRPADLPDPQADAQLDPGPRKSVGHLRDFAGWSQERREAKPVAIEFVFHAAVAALHGPGRVDTIELERTRMDGAGCVPTGETFRLPVDMVVSCIGYHSLPLDGVPYDENAGRISSEEGRIGPQLYCVGWARRGPTGTIGTNRPDGYAVVEKIAADIESGAPGEGGRPGREGFDRIAAQRGLDIVTFRDWKRIEEAEAALAREGAPREKFVDIEAMIRARG